MQGPEKEFNRSKIGIESLLNEPITHIFYAADAIVKWEQNSLMGYISLTENKKAVGQLVR